MPAQMTGGKGMCSRGTSLRDSSSAADVTVLAGPCSRGQASRPSERPGSVPRQRSHQLKRLQLCASSCKMLRHPKQAIPKPNPTPIPHLSGRPPAWRTAGRPAGAPLPRRRRPPAGGDPGGRRQPTAAGARGIRSGVMRHQRSQLQLSRPRAAGNQQQRQRTSSPSAVDGRPATRPARCGPAGLRGGWGARRAAGEPPPSRSC